MKVIKVENQIEGGKVAFEILKEKLANGAQTLGLATGSSPLEFYKEIVESDLDFSNLTSVNLDEYVGLDGDNPQSYRYFMQENLFNQKPFKESFLPHGVKDNAEAEIGIAWRLETICAAVCVFMPEGAVFATLVLKPRRRVAK